MPPNAKRAKASKKKEFCLDRRLEPLLLLTVTHDYNIKHFVKESATEEHSAGREPQDW